MKHVDVTVVTATRNRPTLLAQALDSIRHQTLQCFEVCVVDDGSSPSAAVANRAVVEALDDRFRLILLSNPGTAGSGPAAARNQGMEAGCGRYVAFLDDDDTWVFDGHLEAAVDTLDRTGLDFYCANMEAVRNDVPVWDSWFPALHVAPLLEGQQVSAVLPIYRGVRADFIAAAGGRVVHPNMLVLRRSLVSRVGGFLRTLRYAEDTEFVLRVLDATESVLFCPQIVARYRLPEAGSHSLTMTRIEQELQTLAATQHLRMFARSHDVRSAARNIESWTLRVLSRFVKNQGQHIAAVSLALQAVAVQPTAGAVLHLARILLPTLGVLGVKRHRPPFLLSSVVRSFRIPPMQ